MRALRFRTRAGGEGDAEAGVVLEGLGIGLAVETRSCHVARPMGRRSWLGSWSPWTLAQGEEEGKRRLWCAGVGNGEI